MHRTVVLFIAASLDGFIATPGGGIEWLNIVQTPGEDYGYAEFYGGVDTVILGRKTYDKILSFGIDFPHKTKQCFVISGTRSGSENGVEFFGGSLEQLIADVRTTDGGSIFVDGGAGLVHSLLRRQLIDRFILSTIPILLGNGIPLFRPGFPETRLRLIRSRSFPSGLVQTTYDILRA